MASLPEAVFWKAAGSKRVARLRHSSPHCVLNSAMRGEIKPRSEKRADPIGCRRGDVCDAITDRSMFTSYGIAAAILLITE